MDVRYTGRSHVVGVVNDFSPLEASGDMATFGGNRGSMSERISLLEVKLSDGTWKGMDEAFRDGDLIADEFRPMMYVESHKVPVEIPPMSISTSLRDVQEAARRLEDKEEQMDAHTKQVAIPARTVEASLRHVQEAAAQFLGGAYRGPHEWRIGVENTDGGVIVRGPWREPGADLVTGTWTATYQVEKEESGKSTLSGTFAVDFRRDDSLPPRLEAIAAMQSTNLAVAAEGLAQELSPKKTRVKLSGFLTRGAERVAGERSAESERAPVEVSADTIAVSVDVTRYQLHRASSGEIGLWEHHEQRMCPFTIEPGCDLVDGTWVESSDPNMAYIQHVHGPQGLPVSALDEAAGRGWSMQAGTKPVNVDGRWGGRNYPEMRVSASEMAKVRDWYRSRTLALGAQGEQTRMTPPSERATKDRTNGGLML